MVRETFGGIDVEVSEDDLPEKTTDALVLTNDEEVIATSDLDSLRRAILMVNSDLYSTGSIAVEEIELPGVLLELSETNFEVRGYPMSNYEKLVLVVLSRYIEKQALDAGEGTLRATFQRLSRLDDEHGTKRVYERLSKTDLDVHIYGVPDWEPPSSMEVTTHTGTSEEYRRTWVVSYLSPSEEADLAMVAYETEANVYEGFWTFDTRNVRTIDQAVQSLPEE
jgi:hypothetical protein